MRLPEISLADIIEGMAKPGIPDEAPEKREHTNIPDRTPERQPTPVPQETPREPALPSKR